LGAVGVALFATGLIVLSQSLDWGGERAGDGGDGGESHQEAFHGLFVPARRFSGGLRG
jgi:hypothetical protein